MLPHAKIMDAIATTLLKQFRSAYCDTCRYRGIDAASFKEKERFLHEYPDEFESTCYCMTCKCVPHFWKLDKKTAKKLAKMIWHMIVNARRQV